MSPGLRTAVSTAVARRLFHSAVNRLDVTVHERGRQQQSLGRGGPAAIIHRPEEFYARLGRDGLIGFGEAYQTHAWDAEDLGAFLSVLAAELPTLIPAPLQRLRAVVRHRSPHHQRSTRANSRANIAHHYDLSNELFARFLDETLSYSSALFATSLVAVDDSGDHLVASPPETTDSARRREADARRTDPELAAAQARKLERLLDEAGVAQGSRVLEIGTGWGELAIRAARRGARVHSITLSVEQLDLARQRVEAAGVADLVHVDLMDYRELGAPEYAAAYDAVLSVEMIEAVGHEFWGTYFKTIDHVLADGGRVAIQAIAMPHDRMLVTQGSRTWITKYIFPGGFLPSVQVIDEVTRGITDLRLRRRLDFGSHYAETLRRWDDRFLAHRDELAALGFDDAFMRMWHFYLDYSRAGFAGGYIDVHQLTLTRETRS